MTMPVGRPLLGDDQRLAVAGQQLDRLAHRVAGGDARGTAPPSRRRSRRPCSAGSSTACLSSPRSPIEPTTDVGSCARRPAAARRGARAAARSRRAPSGGSATTTSGGISPARRLGAQHVADRAVAGALEEAVLGHPRVVEDLRQVARARRRGGSRRPSPPGRRCSRATSSAACTARPHEPPTSMPSVSASRRVVRNESRSETRHVAVDDRRVVGRRPEVLADALDEVGLDLVVGVDRADRVGADDLDGRVLLLEVAPDAGDRAAGADADDEVRDAPAGLAPQLRPGRLVVRLRVGRVAYWLGWKAPGISCGQAVGDAVVGLRRVGRDVGRRDHDLGAVGAQEVDLLACDILSGMTAITR